MAIQKVTSSLIADNSVGVAQLNVTDGTDGQLLKTNGSGTLSFVDAAGGGGAWNVISSQTVSSSVAYVTFTGLTGYANYKIVWNGVYHTGHPTWLYFEASSDNGSNWYTSGSNWQTSMLYSDSASSSLSFDTSWSNSSGKCSIVRNIHQYNTDQTQDGEILFFSLNPSRFTHFKSTSVHQFFNDRVAFTQVYGGLRANVGFNAIRFAGGSNITGGTFTLYGLSTS